MNTRLIEFLLQLAPREKRLLALLILGVIPLAIWFGWLAPLTQARAQAARDLARAHALQGWVQEQVAIQSLFSPVQDTGPRAAIGTSQLEQELISAGLRDQVSTLANRADGGIELSFEAVEFGGLMQWLVSSDPDWGYDISSFRIERGTEPGIIAATFRLEAQE
jgi:general secretion pathway protein M